MVGNNEHRSSGPSYYSNTVVYPIMITLYSLRAGDEAKVALRDDATENFGDSISGSKRVGIFIGGGTPGSALPIGRFLVSKKFLSISVIDDASEIRLRLYAHNCGSRIGGNIFLPPTARMAIESSIDRVVIAAGSFGLDLR
jgi:hypothetical protein